MLKHTAAMIVAAAIVLGATTVAALANSYSRHNHMKGMVLVAGTLIGGGAAHSGAVGARY